METNCFRYIRSEEGGSWTIPAIVSLLHEVEEAPSHTASCLSWRTSGALQQIFNHKTLAPAHPLTADLHFDDWLSVEDYLIPVGLPGSLLLDLTNPTIASRANRADFTHRLPHTITVVVTLGRPGRHVVEGLAAKNYILSA